MVRYRLSTRIVSRQMDGHVRLAAYGRIFSNPPGPGQARQNVGEHNPHSLNEQAAQKLGARGFSHINADREIELVGKRREIKNSTQRGRKYVQRKQVAAGDVLEGK